MSATFSCKNPVFAIQKINNNAVSSPRFLLNRTGAEEPNPARAANRRGEKTNARLGCGFLSKYPWPHRMLSLSLDRAGLMPAGRAPSDRRSPLIAPPVEPVEASPQSR